MNYLGAAANIIEVLFNGINKTFPKTKPNTTKVAESRSNFSKTRTP